MTWARIAVLAGAIVAVALVLRTSTPRAPVGTTEARAPSSPAAGEPRRDAAHSPEPSTGAVQPDDATDAGRRVADTAPRVPYVENLVWGNIDLREAKAAMPDNLYWQWGAPTNDPEVLRAREAEQERRNQEYGRVLSGDADEQEVNAYWDHRERLSSDYLEFAQWMRERYGDDLPEQMRGLLDLSIKLNTARLLQIPVDRERSIEHSRTRAQIRAEWRRQQEEFGELPR